MAMEWVASLVVLAMAAVLGVQSQSSDSLGFITIDCGLGAGSSYVDPKSNISYVSDAGFIDSGVNANISGAYASSTMVRRLLTVRSFPDGARNCYTVAPVTAGSKYLLRAWFMYGNYDGRDDGRPLHFDLHLGVNFWGTMNITDPSLFYTAEAIAVAAAEYFSVCLVNTGKGTPFISGLEARPMKSKLYPAANAARSLVLFKRANMGVKDTYIRYPNDRLDRFWEPWSTPLWSNVATNSTVDNVSDDNFEAPTAVMQTAVTAINSSIVVTWDPYPGDVNQYFPILHISDLFNLTGTNQSRQFNVLVNGIMWLGHPMTPDYLFSDSVYSLNPLAQLDTYNITLQALSNSTLPPILNAIEIYSAMSNATLPSDAGDVNAMMAIRASYKIKSNWMGDPCSPEDFSWDGLNCSYSLPNAPRVTTLNLSSSGLTGEIIESFASLGKLEYLDLSYNNLTGTVPSVLADLTSLKLLDVTNNQLNGSIPTALLEKSQNGFLTIRFEGNQHLCDNGTSCKITPASEKKKISTAVIVILCVVLPVIIIVVIALLWRVRRTQGVRGSLTVNPKNEGFTKQSNDLLQLENRQFTCMEIKNITKNFKKILGKGGFGSVFYGCLENGTPVAVKILSQSSSQGAKEFLAEAQHLTRVHHRNLVSLVGYCNDGDTLGLVYEYMSEGTLQQHLRGSRQDARVLSWGQRLQIALDSAEGLEYLHKGCKPPLIHRDVKTGNILLNEKLEAKIADFGLSKAFQSESNTHISTAVVGTPGYLDPEYYNTFQLSEKSDVYSFGVVLLELITGLPPIVQQGGAESLHIAQWVLQRLSRGNIEEAVDAKLRGKYDANSVWKCADAALKCTSQGPHQRPTMAEVVVQLKESLELETSHERDSSRVNARENLYTEVSDVSQNSVIL